MAAGQGTGVGNGESEIPDKLDRIVYANGQTLALSDNLTAEEAAQWRSMVTLDPLPDAQAIGIFGGKRFLLVRVQQPKADSNSHAPTYEMILLPRKVLQQAAGNLDPLLALVREPLSNAPFQPQTLPSVRPWTLNERSAYFQGLLAACGGQMTTALALLGAAIDERGLLIRGFDADSQARVRLVQGIMALLPVAARPDITFATNVEQPGEADPRVIFSENPQSAHWTADFATKIFPQEAANSQYPVLLAKLWNDDADADATGFMRALGEMDTFADALLTRDRLRLAAVAEQFVLNQQVMAGADIPVDILKAALELPLPPEVRLRYVSRLLHYALDNRDTEAALIVAMEMDADPVLDMVLGNALTDALRSQPDAVYVFVRTRLNDAMEMDERWLDRLEAAALVAVRVAISDADAETIINWLRLIAREPANFGLSDVLHQGILAAQVRAHEAGDLARQIILIAVKRDPETLDTLLNDKELVRVLPDNMGRVLRDLNGEPMLTLQQRGPEMFLVALARNARLQATRQFTPTVIEQIWKMYTSGQHFNLPLNYRPDSVIEAWLANGAEWLSEDAQAKLLTLMLADGQDDLFYRFVHQMREQKSLTHLLLVEALQNSQRNINDFLLLLGRITTAGDISQQEAVNIYVELLNLREWRQAALPLVEQLARMMQQHPTLDILAETVWRLLEVAARSKSEGIARVAARQLFNDIEQQIQDDQAANDAALVEMLARLFEQLQWSVNTRQYALNWWRDFTRQQPMARLARLDKLMENKSLADARTILQTTLAFRRMLGKRSIQDFAQALNTAFSILEDITQSFDPSPRRAVSFDEDTIRAELDARQEELTEDEKRILAKNLKELAQLIGEMGDHRSKANLMRRGENIDRQLMTGEQQPASAVDAMKWMSGYLDGVQDQDKEGDE